MLCTSRHIDTAELHVGAMCSTLLDLLTAICQLEKKLTGTKSHVYLELCANCQKSINMHVQKNAHTFRFVC